MATSGLKMQLKNVVKSMVDEGILIEMQFAQLQELKNADDPYFVSRVLSEFCDDAENTITELNNHLAEEQVDYGQINILVHRLKGSSAGIGALEVCYATVNLIRAVNEQVRESTSANLKIVTQEYLRLQYKLQTMIQVCMPVAYGGLDVIRVILNFGFLLGLPFGLENKICEIEAKSSGRKSDPGTSSSKNT